MKKLAKSVLGADRARLSLGESLVIAKATEDAGFAIEPDARLTNKAYSVSETAAVFSRIDGGQTDTARYTTARAIATLCISVAMTDGVAQPSETAGICDGIAKMLGLPAHETRRLEALVAVLLVSRIETATVGSKLRDSIPLDLRARIGRFLVAIAATEGISQQEQAKLRSCFRQLGLPSALLTETIAELSAGNHDDMVVIDAGDKDADRGERIPPRQSGLRLNMDAIGRIMTETQEVSRLLANAMAETEEEAERSSGASSLALPEAAVPEIDTTASAVPAIEKHPPAALEPFFSELCARDRWSSEEARNAASRHGLMLGGTIESINEWAFDALGGLLIEEVDGGFEINTNLL
ncbi:MAG: tellurite resistance TerB C-terminal domain-containing protein [Phycisphaerales bacterium]